MKLLALSLMSLSLCAQQVAPSIPRTVVSDTMKDLSGQALVGDLTLTLNDPQYIFVRRVPATAGVFSVSLYPGTYSVVIHSSTFGIDRSENWVVPNSGSVQTLSDVGSPSANITGGGSGTFVTLSGDASSTPTGGATVVNGLKGVPFCTGYTPTEGQFVEWTALSTPNPCYMAAAGGSGSGVSLVLDTGSANAYTSAAGGPTLADGLIVNLRTLHANSGASTFAYNAGTARAIVDQAGNVLVSGMIPVGNVLLQYQASGTTWRLLQPNLGTAAFSASSAFQAAGSYAPATSGSGPLKGNGSGGFSAAGYSDIVGLWTTCSGYLKSAGTCDTPAGFANPMAGVGDLIYGGTSGAATKLSGDTSNTRKFLRQQSTGGSPAAPAWDTITGPDLPNPGASSKGGTQSKDCTGTGHILSINTDGTVACSADSGGGGTWGSITGTLSSQTDLASALGGKQATITGAPGTWPTFGGAALLSVGTTAGTVAAGNDSRITGAVQSGGALGTPSSGDASNLTNFPTLNQSTTGTAAGLTSQYVDWSAASGGASIANKPALGTAASHASTDFAASNAATTVNGQTCALGGSCTINAGSADILRFSICITAGCGSETTINYIATMGAGSFTECAFNLATAATGSTVTVDVQDGSGNSIFNTTDHCQTDTSGCLNVTVANGTAVEFQSSFKSPGTYARGSKYNATVAVGHNDSGNTAQGGTVQCR